MNGKCLSFHLFKRVEKKSRSVSSDLVSSMRNGVTRLREFCTSSDSSSVVSSYSMSSMEELFTTAPPRWTFQEFSDISEFIRNYIDNSGTFNENSKTALLLQQCHYVIIIQDVHFGYSRIPDEVQTFTPDRLVVAAIILSNENTALSYGLNNLLLNDTFDFPAKRILVDSMIFNERIKASKRRVLAIIIIHHLVQLCKTNDVASINASSNDETYQYFLDSGFSC